MAALAGALLDAGARVDLAVSKGRRAPHVLAMTAPPLELSPSQVLPTKCVAAASTLVGRSRTETASVCEAADMQRDSREPKT